MFRRRTATPEPPPEAEPRPAPVSAGQLRDQGWVLPRGLDRDRAATPTWTLVGTVGSPTATPVDPAGLVVGEGWSLDWWIGGDDRWHLPAREAGVRQDLLDDAPVVETRLRIPGGDAVHRAYGVRSPRGTGDEWVVVEVENATPVPLAAALVVRPLIADALGAIGTITIEPVDGGRGADQAHLVRIDGDPALVLPRKPAQVAVGDRATGDVVELVTSGGAASELLTARCPDGLATLAVVFPVPHTAVLRLALPVGEVDPAEAVAYPSVLPDAATVASGWEIHRRGTRISLPERRVQAAVDRARAHLHLAHDGSAVRRDGREAPALEPGATEVILAAFDQLDRPAEVGAVVARWQEVLAEASPEVDAMALEAIATHWLLHRDQALLDWMLPEVAAAVERLDRADRKGKLADDAVRERAGVALGRAAELFALADQPRAAAQVTSVAERVAGAGTGHRLEGPGPSASDALRTAVDAASATGAIPGPGRHGRGIGHDLAAAAGLVVAARNTLVDDRDGELRLLPQFPVAWYGGGIELHDAPTALGRLSYAVRWHGTRPALLWELEPHDGVDAVRISVPGLDPSWSTTELRGDALLAEVAPPEGLDTITFVPDHPDIDPEMRRPGADPEPPAGPLPEGGTFS